MGSLYKDNNSHYTEIIFKPFLINESHSFFQAAKYHIWKLGLTLIMVSICACQSTQSTELETKPVKANELEMRPIEAIPEVAHPQNPCPIPQIPVDNQALTNLHTTSQVELEIRDIQQKSFDLAVETAQSTGRRDERLASASIMYQRLTELHPLISCEASKQTLAIIWSDARLDIGYVLSDGKELARPGLYVYVQALRQKNIENKETP
ncbi:hypothetical protein QUA00_00230 [Microcoleus sp. T2B6]|uniref:hypothetical protein n=1 Tax=Microcoleus sp. T2B6 TaxID=3055424 RepID=UPI002FD2D72B